ncbi:MAG: dienelactone hydrolase family protein [Chitinophagales bacterium]
MKTLNLILILSFAIFTQALQSQTVSPSPIWKAGRNDVRIEVENASRHFIVSIPQNYTGKQAFPVVLMFHGTSGTGEKFYNISGWKEKGEEEGIITVFPTALKYCYIDEGQQKNNTKWNDGKLETYVCSGVTLKDDVLFVRKILVQMRSHLNIDDSRIYASGFSNGAGFVSRLAVELSDELAAVAAVAGGLQTQITATPKAFIPICLMVGNQDDRFIAAHGGQPLPYQPADLEQDPLIRDFIGRFLNKFELSEQHTTIERKHQIILKFEENTNTTNDNLFVFSMVQGLKHNYPNGKNHPLKGARIFWEFFKQYSK